ncbi:MAG: hypothetical protein V2I82_17390, partial [Halieaceae bacterium]|jgi:hypothetical protein|nr:hypothetical protein [Halieaceae bacterium]
VDPRSFELQLRLADQLYFQRRFEEAIPLFEASMADTIHGRLVPTAGGMAENTHLADALRRVGRDADAVKLMDSIEGALAAQQAVGTGGWWHLDSAALAAIRGNQEQLEYHLEQAIEVGFDWYQLLNLPMFSRVAASEGFQSLRQRAQELNAKNRIGILRLICDENPIPEHWRALDTTCNHAPQTKL